MRHRRSGARDPVGETRMIVRAGDPGGPRDAGVGHQEITAIACQIDGSRKAARTAADHETIQRAVRGVGPSHAARSHLLVRLQSWVWTEDPASRFYRLFW